MESKIVDLDNTIITIPNRQPCTHSQHSLPKQLQYHTHLQQMSQRLRIFTQSYSQKCSLHTDEINSISHLICFLVKNNGQRQNCTPFFQRSSKSLPVAVEFTRLQANGRRCIVASVTEALCDGRYVTDVGTDVLHSRMQFTR